MECLQRDLLVPLKLLRQTLFDFYKQLYIPEKLNQNFALIFINYYENNMSLIFEEKALKINAKKWKYHPR